MFGLNKKKEVKEEKKELYRAKISFKSGNVVCLENLTKLEAKCVGNETTSLSWTHTDDHKGFRILNTSLDLSQIECIVYQAQT